MLTTKEVADILGITHQEVARRARLGILPAVRSNGRWEFSRRAVEKYAKRRRGPGRPKGTGK